MAALFDGQRGRLLQVDILPCKSGFHGGLRVPMIWGTDTHGIDTFVTEQFLVIGVGLETCVARDAELLCVRRFDLPLAVGHTYLIEIANSDVARNGTIL